jgi:hypothetical protein
VRVISILEFTQARTSQIRQLQGKAAAQQELRTRICLFVPCVLHVPRGRQNSVRGAMDTERRQNIAKKPGRKTTFSTTGR